MPTRLWMVPDPTWKTTAAALREVESSLPRWLRDEMRNETETLVNQAKSAVMRVDVRGGPTRSTGLRKRVAAGVGIRAGIGRDPYLRVYTSMADRTQAPIPRGLDQTTGWRHPLFGDRSHWYQSTPTKPGWFTDTIADGADEIERALERALERAARHVDAAG